MKRLLVIVGLFLIVIGCEDTREQSCDGCGLDVYAVDLQEIGDGQYTLEYNENLAQTYTMLGAETECGWSQHLQWDTNYQYQINTDWVSLVNPGSMTDEEGSAKCVKCGAGEASTGIDGKCESCSEGRYRPSKEDDKWTFTITTQDATASAGVAVTQTVLSDIVKGTLQTALNGADIKTMVVAGTTGGSFVSTTDIVIGTGSTAITIAHATITKVDKITPTNPTFCKLQFLFIYIHISNTY